VTGRTPAEAVRSYRNTLQRALSCVTPNILLLSPHASAPTPYRHEVTLSGSPVPLTGEGRIALRVRSRFIVVSTDNASRLWQARTIGYFYTLHEINGREILGYHWHPTGSSHETEPHLHLEAGAEIGRPDLAKAHLPTGHVALNGVLRFVIRDLGVRLLRSDWAQILERTGAASP
jgi:hypothetical protein